METVRLNEGFRRNWTRSQGGVIAGVCEGLSRQFDINVALIRLAWIGSIVFFGTGLILYFLFWVALPRENQSHEMSRARLFGVCQRIAARQGLDVGLVRLIALLLTGLSFGATIVGYLVLHVALPQSQQEEWL